MRDRWNHLLLGSLLLGHLILLSMDEQSRGSILERWTLSALGPAVHSVRATFEGATELFDSMQLAGSLRRENRQLRREIADLRRQLVRLHGVEEELQRLSRLADYTRFDTDSFYVADVVYIDRDSWLRTLVIYTGDEMPVRNQPVVTAQGLVGRIIVPARRYAKVLLLTDRSASVSAMIRRTRRQGMIRGDGESLLLDNIPLLADVVDGDLVVTAGIDGVFPRGIPIGQVTAVAPDRRGLFHRIVVTPAIDFGLLDQVYVLKEAVVPAEVRERLSGDGGTPP